mmetsp:Transcript_16914/g.33669  ORF Transcript_16914/g.33669 Transcript_16914/m.33669 type:complete len:179 (-) Transcript_16914:142-678(-)|eukprot:CAMPEP_0194309086 /NCGR_PEP_ID=MMETSP0171-20130528/6064_1 /TAXON_ID=218684 /ORGANISM="Corethron pennatum, Strain L29A3" /LENGTH=178 /DNA_ID=CAMNT_0039062081 /DNA_START=95 /DNA_END=631 /DNA_ORIENTATION=-
MCSLAWTALLLAAAAAAVPTSAVPATAAFAPRPRGTSATAPRPLASAGGWGKRIKEYGESEYNRDDSSVRPFENYELQDSSDFLRKVASERTKLLKKKDDDFIAIARAAGLSDQSGDGIAPMGQFEADEFGADEIDVSTVWEDGTEPMFDQEWGPTREGESITRMDGPSDVAGSTGQW